MGVIQDGRLRVVVATADAGTAAVLLQHLQCKGSFLRGRWGDHAATVLKAQAHWDPDVVVTDGTLADLDAETFAERLARDHAGVPVIVLAGRLQARQLLEALQTSGRGTVVRVAGVDEVTAAIESSLRQNLSKHRSSHPRTLVDSAAWEVAATLGDGVFDGLTRRELQIMSELACGNDNRAIGQHLGIRDGTVSAYIRRLRDKLGVQTRRELIEISECQRCS